MGFPSVKTLYEILGKDHAVSYRISKSFFRENSKRLKGVNFFHKNLHHRYLTGFWTRLCWGRMWCIQKKFGISLVSKITRFSITRSRTYMAGTEGLKGFEFNTSTLLQKAHKALSSHFKLGQTFLFQCWWYMNKNNCLKGNNLRRFAQFGTTFTILKTWRHPRKSVTLQVLACNFTKILPRIYFSRFFKF